MQKLKPTTYQLKRALVAMIPEYIRFEAPDFTWVASRYSGALIRDTEWLGLAIIAEGLKASGKGADPSVIALLNLVDPAVDGERNWSSLGQFANYTTVALVRSASWELRVAALVEYLGMSYVDDPEQVRKAKLVEGLRAARVSILEEAASRKAKLTTEISEVPYSLQLDGWGQAAAHLARAIDDLGFPINGNT